MVGTISAIALFGCERAYAFLSTTGTGSATGTAGDVSALTLTPGTPTSALYPGAVGDVTLTASNPNPATVHISALALDTTQGTGGLAVDANHAGCTLSAVSFTTQTNGGNGWTVPGKVGATAGTLVITLSSALAMALSAPNACQGATFTVFLAAS